uniref:Uncharacterized protein n=1 Tax=Tanacetum cinerariifolium TaxID=118510 RepID=A0A6L2LWI4_TANCI|nr:hypothetical protein [Tanacetum cinerariifolium]
MRHFARDYRAKGNKKLLAEALKEKEDLQTKVENWQNSSKNLNRLLNTQMSANDKFGLGYEDYRYGSILSYENEVLQSVSMNKECDLEDTPVNDKYAKGMHATSVDESYAKTSKNATCESDTSVETTTSMPATVEDALKVVSEPKVWIDAHIIEEYESDSDDDSVSNVPEEKDKPSFASTDTAKHVKTSRENVKDIGTPTHYPKVEKQGRNSHIRKGLGYAFTRKSCFVCGSFSHLIKDCDFHEKRIAKHDELTIIRTKGTKLTLQIIKTLRVALLPLEVAMEEYTPQQNGVAERKNMTLIEAASTMLVDLFLPTTFWAEAVNTACYVLNKFDGKSALGFSVGYSLNSKAFRVYNLETKRVEENLHVNFLENKPNVTGKGHAWMFDLDYLTNSINYKPISLENQANKSACPSEAKNSAGTQANDDQGANSKEINLHDEHFVLPIWSAYSTIIKSLGHQIQKSTDCKTCKNPEATYDSPNANTNNTNLLNDVSALVSAVGPSRALNDVEPLYLDDPSMPHLEDIFASSSNGIFTNSSYDNEGVVTDFNNLETTGMSIQLSQLEFTPFNQKLKFLEILSLEDESWVDAMQEELLQFQIQKVWILVDLPFGKKAIGTKWVYMNKKDETGVVVRNKARLVVQGHRQEEGIDYDGSTKKSWCDEFEELMKNRFQMSSMGELAFFLRLQTASTPIETWKPLVKDEEAADVDDYLYRFQVTPKTSHLQAVKRIFRYLKGQLKLGLLYLKVSSFDLEAYSDSDYPGATLDRKSTTGGCQFLGKRLILWQCKKQTTVATSTIEAEYVAIAYCCGKVLWINN